jgi:hypothetical protein
MNVSRPAKRLIQPLPISIPGDVRFQRIERLGAHPRRWRLRVPGRGVNAVAKRISKEWQE